MAESVKLSFLGNPIHPEDITLRFVSNLRPEKEIIIYDKYPFSFIVPHLYRDIKNLIVSIFIVTHIKYMFSINFVHRKFSTMVAGIKNLKGKAALKNARKINLNKMKEFSPNKWIKF